MQLQHMSATQASSETFAAECHGVLGVCADESGIRDAISVLCARGRGDECGGGGHCTKVSTPWSRHCGVDLGERHQQAVERAAVSHTKVQFSSRLFDLILDRQEGGENPMASFDYDVVIIGSGFGGSVAALRAAEKGYRVGVMEAGRRWRDEDIPKTNWDLKDYLWFPAAELYGIQRIEYLDDVLILCGAGVGGGSHVYGNTLYVPPKQFFDAPEWAAITDWADELAPCYDQARRMLGVVRYPYMPTDLDRYMQQVATEMGRGETFNKTPVGVYFGKPGVEAEDPYFGGRRAPAHRMHLLRQVPGRLRPQRQEQGDDELPVSGGEARRTGPRAARGLRPRAARWRRVRGACASSWLGAARRACSPPHVHRRAGDRCRPRLWLVEAPSSHAAQGPPDRAVEPARATRADELRTDSRRHASLR